MPSPQSRSLTFGIVLKRKHLKLTLLGLSPASTRFVKQSTAVVNRPLVRQRLICTKQQPDAGAVAQLGQKRGGGVQIGNVGIGRVGPDRFIDNLCRLFSVHMESSFQAVGLLAGLAVAAMANRGRFGGPAVLVFENTPERGRGIDLRVGSEGL